MKQLSKLMLIASMMVTAVACKEEDPAVDLTISGFSPSGAVAGAEVEIFGTGFGTDASAVAVKFGTAEAEVSAVTATTITTSVPASLAAGDVKISVTVDGETVESDDSFTVGQTTIEVTGDITANTTWSKANRYLIKSTLSVKSGAVLTIEAGTIIKGDKATTGTLVVEKGARIEAVGTAAQPIVFTSNKPKGERSYGDWGGIVLMGNAPTNRVTETSVEGITGKTYGGATATAATDNSGTLKYVRIEFAGVPITPGNELNGLTLAGVGSGTTIEYVQVSYSGDDAFEWFGGTVNAKYLISYRTYDDDFDTDFGYTGKVQYGLALRDPYIADQSQSNGFETDNDGTGTTAAPFTAPVFSNISFIGGERLFRGTQGTNSSAGVNNANYGRGIHLRRNSRMSLHNSLIAGSWLAGLAIDGTASQGAFESGAADAAEYRNNIFAASATASGTARGGDFAFESGGAFTATTGTAAGTAFTANGNTSVTQANTTTLMIANLIAFNNLAAPTLLPGAGSPLLTGDAFTGKADVAFFDKVAFKGAFGAADWTSGWANFDPQNADY